MARIRGYIASSLDGYIATPTGGIDWLTPYDTADFGEFAYAPFIATIRMLVMGRGTYDFIAGQPSGWPYGDRRAYLVTSRPLEGAPALVEAWTHGVDALVAQLRRLDDGEVWLIGGGKLQNAFISCGALDELDLFVVPEMIGAGIRLFPEPGPVMQPQLVSATALDRGCVHMRYRFLTGPK
jgi:dihydrofolate reductase